MPKSPDSDNLKANLSKKRIFPTAQEDAIIARRGGERSSYDSLPAYQLAYTDDDFMLSERQRGIRLQLELEKAEQALQRHNVESAIVIFGSARTDPQHKSYQQARELAARTARESGSNGLPNLHVITGGGPGIMEAANRGAFDEGGDTVGLNIVLPHEQEPNKYITPELCFQFHYFAIRKMHFLMRAKVLVVFPGGFGTLDELFDALTLIQTQKIKPMPILVFDEAYWKKLINLDFLIDEGMISAQDSTLIQYVNTVDDAWAIIRQSLLDSEAESN
jgi:uncharacterized protein (TIGR00730 family)